MIYYGDEAAMEGGGDPDCRRGMLWDEDRRDGEMFEYYQTLLRIRRGYPALTEGELLRQYADNESGLIRMERQLGDVRMTALFHTKKGNVELEKWAGRQELVRGTCFSGCLGAYETAVFVE